MDVASCLGWAGKNSRIRKESVGAHLRNPFRTVPGVYTSCVTIFNTRSVGELWLLAATFLKGQEVGWLRWKSPLRDKWSGLCEIQRIFELVMAATAVGTTSTTATAVESASTTHTAIKSASATATAVESASTTATAVESASTTATAARTTAAKSTAGRTRC